MKQLPEWARELVPVDMDGAAVLLGISRRFLIETLKNHPYFERRGAKKVFYREHIMQLREAMSEPPASKPNKDADFSLPLSMSKERAFEEAMRLATQKPKQGLSGKLRKAKH